MDTAKVKTPDDFLGPPSSPKRKRHTSIACECCRKLKVKCLGGEAAAVSGASSTPKPCNHCVSQSKTCVWPEEDGRKKVKTSSPASSDISYRNGRRDTGMYERQSSIPSVPRQGSDLSQEIKRSTSSGISPTSNPHAFAGNTSNYQPPGERSDSNASQTPYTTVNYSRHLGPTAIAPGHKSIKLKVKQDDSTEVQAQLDALYLGRDGAKPLFDPFTGLPVEALLPALLDAFFRYYGDNFCHMNRRYLDMQIENGKASTFLVCVMTALSSRFCPPGLFADFFPPKADGSERKSWEFSKPFLERAKTITMAAVDLPSADVIAGLIMLAFVDFGDNNEAGLWMFTGMAIRMVIELGLHRERSCLDVGGSQVEAQPKKEKLHGKVSEDDYLETSQLVLFWVVYTLDVSLCNGTGRVPGLKHHEINARLPTDTDLAIIRAGPGGFMKPIHPEVYPQTARMMLAYAQSIDYLNTGSRQIRYQSDEDNDHRMNRIEDLKGHLIAEYRQIPKDVGFGANCYQAAVNGNQAGPYLLLHLQYHLQIAFLTQESLAGEEEKLLRAPDRSVTVEEPIDRRPNLDVRRVNQELYRHAIKCITDMLTFAKLIDDSALLTTIFANQAFFHAACAYSRDMVQNTKPRPGSSTPSALPKEANANRAFPIPNQTSPSLVFQYDDHSQYPRNLIPRTASQSATESTFSFLALIAKANYQFLRQAIKDQTRIYAGSGWVDAVLDQRETGLRDVDLSIVSESISTFIRLHDLREPGASESALQKFAPSGSGFDSGQDIGMDESWTQMPYDFLADTNLNFDPQAFFNDYMYSELSHQGSFQSGPMSYDNQY